MKVSPGDLLQWCRRHQQQRLPEDILVIVCDIACRQIQAGKWTHGRPAAVFIRDGFPCIRYEDGMWWHYDLADERWF